MYAPNKGLTDDCDGRRDKGAAEGERVSPEAKRQYDPDDTRGIRKSDREPSAGKDGEGSGDCYQDAPGRRKRRVEKSYR